MQAKDVPEIPILRFLLFHSGRWCGWRGEERNVLSAMPPNTPPKVALSKMASLIKRGLVDGCACGCPGYFVLTLKGEEYIIDRLLTPTTDL